jgi:hypothetical protein
MNMAGGRPRTVSFSEDEMIELGNEMVSFVTVNKKDILHLCEWYTIEKGFTYNEWKTFIQRPEFVPYYEQALRLWDLSMLIKIQMFVTEYLKDGKEFTLVILKKAKMLTWTLKQPEEHQH